jgi:hypothetical protein
VSVHHSLDVDVFFFSTNFTNVSASLIDFSSSVFVKSFFTHFAPVVFESKEMNSKFYTNTSCLLLVICLSNHFFIVLDTRMIWISLNYKKRFRSFSESESTFSTPQFTTLNLSDQKKREDFSY